MSDGGQSKTDFEDLCIDVERFNMYMVYSRGHHSHQVAVAWRRRPVHKDKDEVGKDALFRVRVTLRSAVFLLNNCHHHTMTIQVASV